MHYTDGPLSTGERTALDKEGSSAVRSRLGRLRGSNLGELLEPAVVARAVWPPANEAGWRSEPPRAVQERVSHLSSKRNTAPADDTRHDCSSHLLALCLFLVGLERLVAGPTGRRAVLVGQAAIVTSDFLVSLVMQRLGNSRVRQVSGRH